MSTPIAKPVAVVTGASSGIGRWIALGLARQGCHTVLIGRDAVRLGATADWIAGQVADASLAQHRVDLSLLHNTRALADELVAQYPAIAVLVTNAGVFLARRAVTGEGRERVLATNHLSPFLLTERLLPALKAHAARAGSARIVTVGSDMSDRASVDPDNLELTQGWNFIRAYGQSKLAQMMTIFDWAERLRSTGVTANVVHPGAVATGLVRTPGIIGLAWRCMGPFLLTEEAGAVTPLYVATDHAVEGMTGRYFKKKAVVAPNRRTLDPALRQRVWDATEACIARN